MTDHDAPAPPAKTALVGMAMAPVASQTSTPAGAASLIGKTVNGRYRIKRLLGEGGMGGVYEGEHLEIGKRVAIKLVHALHARDGHVAARIRQEARSTSAIESEHIVQVFDAGEDEELGIFLVMELLKGEDLAKILARKKRMSQVTAAALVAQAATGLARAHAAGIVHRDLKPANVFLVSRDDGTSLVKLVDFGIAKVLRDAQQQQQPGLTRMGMVIGTPQYMSPEQAQGLTTVDHRTDVYSLGALLFEVIVGQSPFPEMPTYEQTILQIMTRPAPRLADVMPDVHPELDRLCSEMMAMDPNARVQDMTTVRDRLHQIFPDIAHSRSAMRSFTDEAALDVTSFAGAPVSTATRNAMDGAPRSGMTTGQRLAQPASRTQSAMSVSHRGERDEMLGEDVPGIAPRRKLGATIAGIAGGVAVLILGAAVITKAGGAKTEEKAQGGFALVQSTVAPEASQHVAETLAPATAATTAAPLVATQPATPPAAAAPTSPPATRAPGNTSATKPATKSATPSAPHGAQGLSASAPKQAPPAAPAATVDHPAAPRPVGGTGVSTEF